MVELTKFVSKKIDPFYEDGERIANDFFDSIEQKVKFIKSNKRVKAVNFEKKFFLKTKDSMVRSVLSNLNVQRAVIEQSDLMNCEKYLNEIYEKAINNFQDFFRMNFLIENDRKFENTMIYIMKTLLTIDGLKVNTKKEGLPYKNAFKRKGYKDFKVFLLYKDYPFEIQFHNKKSEFLFLSTHGIYEVYRSDETPLKHKDLLNGDRIKLYDSVSEPKIDADKVMRKGAKYERQ